MPCLSWGLPAKCCKTGGKLRAKGKKAMTACAFCYAFSGPVNMGPSQRILQANLDEYLENPEKWAIRMVVRIEETSLRYFRFFHSGDLQNVEMLERIVWIVRELPEVRFWLPTQERRIVKEWLESGEIPENLNIRVSSPLVDKPDKSRIEKVTFSMVSLNNVVGLECPARHQGSKCETCRACWDKTVKMVSYPLKIGSIYRPKEIT